MTKTYIFEKYEMLATATTKKYISHFWKKEKEKKKKKMGEHAQFTADICSILKK